MTMSSNLLTCLYPRSMCILFRSRWIVLFTNTLGTLVFFPKKILQKYSKWLPEAWVISTHRATFILISKLVIFCWTWTIKVILLMSKSQTSVSQPTQSKIWWRVKTPKARWCTWHQKCLWREPNLIIGLKPGHLASSCAKC